MASRSRRIPNVNGASLGPLKGVALVDNSKGLVSNAVKSTPSAQRQATNDILLAVKQFVADSGLHLMLVDARMTDVLLGRIASLLDEVVDSFTLNLLAELKALIVDELSTSALSSIAKTVIANYISELFDDDAKVEDIEELKAWMLENVKSKDGAASKDGDAGSEDPAHTGLSKLVDKLSKEDEEVEDEQKDDYKDSTPANNFYTLQTRIQDLFDALNDKLKALPGRAGLLTKITSFMKKGFLGVVSKIAAVGKSIAKATSSIFTGIKKIGKGIVGISAGIGKAIASPFKAISKGIVGLGSKIGKGIASPFKKIGGFFSKLNPFKKSSKEDKKQKLRDKINEKMSKVIDKLWTAIEPFIDKMILFMRIAMVAVVIPMALIAANVLLIVGAITLIGIGLYLAYKWVKAKVKWLWNYITSGELLDDILAGLSAAWEWIKDFGKWMWKLIVDAVKYIFVGMWVDLGKWIWEKLTLFGKWLYDNYIDKYLVQPFKKYIWEPVKKLWNEKIWPKIEPFVKSLTELKNKIVKAFSAWDTNKSIWENLKNIGGIIKNSVVEWWNSSPFKAFYEKYLLPFVTSAKLLFNKLKNLGGFIKDAIKSWWNGDSSLSETLSNIGKKLKDTILEWWRGEDNPVRKVYEKYIAPVIDPLIDKIKAIKQKIGNIVWDFPMGLSIRPFGFLVGKPMKLSDEEKEQREQVTKKLEKADELGKETLEIDSEIAKIQKKISSGDIGWFESKEGLEKKLEKLLFKKLSNETQAAALRKNAEKAANDIALQLIAQAALPIKAIDNMQMADLSNLAENTLRVAAVVEKKEDEAKQQSDDQSAALKEVLNEVKMFRSETMNKLDDPYVVPMPIPLRERLQQNSAAMRSF